MNTIKPTDLTLYIDTFINGDVDKWLCYTDGDFQYEVEDVTLTHGVARLSIPESAFVQMCSGLVKVKAIYKVEDNTYPDGFYNQEKVFETEYFLNCIDIDNRVHLEPPTLTQSTFEFDNETVNLLKYMVGYDHNRMVASNIKQSGVGFYTATISALPNYDFGRGIFSVDIDWEITKRNVGLPTDKEYEYDGTLKGIPSSKWVDYFGTWDSVGTHNVVAHLKYPNDTLWYDGTTEDKTAHVIIVDKYFTKDEVNRMVDVLNQSDANIMATHKADKEALEATDSALNTRITNNKKDIEQKLQWTKDELNERINDTNDDLNALETAISKNFDATYKEISDNKKDIESKLSKAKSDLTATITQNKENQDEENRKFVQQLTTISRNYLKVSDFTWTNIVGAPTKWDWSNITSKPLIPTIDLYDLGVGSLIKFKTTDLQLDSTTTVKSGSVYLRMETQNGDFVSTYMYSQRGVHEYFELHTRDALRAYVKTDDLNTTLGGYVTKTNLNTTLGDYTTTNSLMSLLSGYTTNTSLTNTLKNYITSTSLTNTLKDYVTTSNLNTKLGDYAKKSDLPTDHVTKTELSTTLGGYVKKSDLPTDHVTKTELSTTLGGYVKKNDLPTDHVTTQSLANTLSAYTTTNSLMQILMGYITPQSLANTLVDYVTTSNLNTKLNDYAKKSDIPTIPTNHVTTTELNSTLSQYAKKSDIPEEQNLSEYVKKNELPTDHVTKTELTDTLKYFAKKVDLPTIPTDHVQSTTVQHIVTCTQAEYDAMSSHDPKTFYVIL